MNPVTALTGVQSGVHSRYLLFIKASCPSCFDPSVNQVLVFLVQTALSTVQSVFDRPLHAPFKVSSQVSPSLTSVQAGLIGFLVQILH